MCTAFSYCRDHQQRLQAGGSYAPNASGGSGSGPQALRPARLQWLSNISSGSQIAASSRCAGSLILRACSFNTRHPGGSRGSFRTSKGVPAFAGMTSEGRMMRSFKGFRINRALSLTTQNPTTSICGLEAWAGNSPPFFFSPLAPFACAAMVSARGVRP